MLNFIEFIIGRLSFLRDRYRVNVLYSCDYVLNADAMLLLLAKKMHEFLFNNRTYFIVYNPSSTERTVINVPTIEGEASEV